MDNKNDKGEKQVKQQKVTATYDADSKRYHRFLIDVGQTVVGNIYIPRSQDVPDQVLVTLRTKAQEQKGIRISDED